MDLNILLSQLRPCVTERPYVFISYSSRDRERVWTDALEFQRRGYNVWIDEKNVDKSNASWKDDAIEAVQGLNCRLVLFYVSRDSVSSVPCYNELCSTRSEKAQRLHNGEIGFVSVDVAPVGDFAAFADAVYGDLQDDDTVAQDLRAQRLNAVYGFKNDFFAGDPAPLRVPDPVPSS